MQSSTLAIIIIVLTIISFVLEKIPLAMTAMLSALVMGSLFPKCLFLPFMQVFLAQP